MADRAAGPVRIAAEVPILAAPRHPTGPPGTPPHHAMTPTLASLVDLPRDRILEVVPALLAARQDLPGDGGERLRARVSRVLNEIPEGAFRELVRAFAEAGEDWRPYDANPEARRIADAFMESLVAPGSGVEGLPHLDALVEAVGEGRRGVLVCNHLSYVDTTATWYLLRGGGRAEAADRLTAVAGPKVYEETVRRLAAVALNTLKVPQSARLAHNEAGLTPREVGRLAVASLAQARDLTAAGRLLAIYPEGARSRTGRLGPFIAATARYVTEPGTLVLPMAITGTEAIEPVGASTMRPAVVRLRIGAPLDVDELRGKGEDREGVLRAARRAVVDLLPPAYRPGEGTAELA